MPRGIAFYYASFNKAREDGHRPMRVFAEPQLAPCTSRNLLARHKLPWPGFQIRTDFSFVRVHTEFSQGSSSNFLSKRKSLLGALLGSMCFLRDKRRNTK